MICSRTAPIPYAEASQVSVNFNLGSKWTSRVDEVSNSFDCLNAHIRSADQS